VKLPALIEWSGLRWEGWELNCSQLPTGSLCVGLMAQGPNLLLLGAVSGGLNRLVATARFVRSNVEQGSLCGGVLA
jgi:hypothetical protein